MAAHTSWASEAPALNQTAAFKVEDAASAEVALDNEFLGFGLPRIVGKSAALRRLLDMVRVVAQTNATVLINGETGTGKELIAEAIHKCSDRSSGPFVKVNCAAIPTGLLESELFGHERGAFTGAIARRIGRFELASRGTMFLDEIGEIPLELQPKLLRVLQEREFERLGDSRTLKSDARLIAATNQNLDAMVNEQKFRLDLYYRLNVFPIRVSPLRERPEDIPPLINHFVQQFSQRMSKGIHTIPSETMTALMRSRVGFSTCRRRNCTSVLNSRQSAITATGICGRLSGTRNDRKSSPLLRRQPERLAAPREPQLSLA